MAEEGEHLGLDGCSVAGRTRTFHPRRPRRPRRTSHRRLCVARARARARLNRSSRPASPSVARTCSVGWLILVPSTSTSPPPAAIAEGNTITRNPFAAPARYPHTILATPCVGCGAVRWRAPLDPVRSVGWELNPIRSNRIESNRLANGFGLPRIDWQSNSCTPALACAPLSHGGMVWPSAGRRRRRRR